MSRGVDDLIPIFLAEARERLSALREHLDTVERDPAAREEVRRQLHGLKGASRMLGLDGLATLCHRGEDLLREGVLTGREGLLAILQEIESATAELESGGGAGPPEGKIEGAPSSPSAPPDPRSLRDGVIGVPARVLEDTTERATRLRHLAGAETAGIEELFELARFAEVGVGDREPRQVLATLAISLRQLAMELDRNHGTVVELLRQSQEELVRVHRQPVRPFVRRLARHARELADSLGKDVAVQVEGEDVTLDRRLMAALEESMLHLVRNALDHGLESPPERLAAGKTLPGTLTIGARGEGSAVCIWVQDDGRGLRPDRIARRAHDLGMLPGQGEASLTENDLLNLVFRPGFSTVDHVTELSGRGVGLDAVAAAVHRLGGRLQLESEPGRGTAVLLHIPAVRRGETVFVLAAGSQLAAVSSAHVLRFVRLPVSQAAADGQAWEEVTVEGRRLRFQRLARIFGERPREGEGILVVLSAGESEVGLLVDRSVGEEEVVLQPFPAVAGVHPVFESVTLLSNGTPVPVLSSRLLAGLGPGDLPEVAPDLRSRRLRVLVVDDSRVTRGMLRRALEDGGCSVQTVAAGEEAFQFLQDQLWDCVVTDVEMPGMSGLELTRRIRATPALRHLPVVVISTRGSPQDRLEGLKAGADAYLTKQSMTSRELVRLVRRLGGAS